MTGCGLTFMVPASSGLIVDSLDAVLPPSSVASCRGAVGDVFGVEVLIPDSNPARCPRSQGRRNVPPAYQEPVVKATPKNHLDQMALEARNNGLSYGQYKAWKRGKNHEK